MKKIFVLLFALSFGLLLLACNGTTTTEAPTTAAPTTAAPTTAAPTTAAPTTVVPTTEAPTTTIADAELMEMYEGSHTVSAMGSEVVYLYEIHFNSGDYYFMSEFEMGGEEYVYEETGTYSVSGNTITMTPLDETAVTGEVLASGNISIPIKASSMATRGPRELSEVLVERIYVGTHDVSAMGSAVTYVYQMTFAHGNYHFYSEFEMAGTLYNFIEVGTYAVDGTTLTITPDGGEAVTGTIGDGTVTIGVKASAMASRADRTLSATMLNMFYEGTHTVSAMGSDVVYAYTITFQNGNYAFHSEFEMGGTPYTYDEVGTYSVDSEGVITLTPDSETAVTGQVNDDYSITIPIKASSMATRGDQTLTAYMKELIVTE
jgi:hypothetical protein